jgi:small subunit ribosomal protein S2
VHRTNKWKSQDAPLHLHERNGIHIIDLQQTDKLLEDAYNKVRNTVADGGTILFVGTKRQAQETIQLEANAAVALCQPALAGGTLTNWSPFNSVSSS